MNTHNSGKWSDGKFNSFIKSILRSGSNKWPPKWECRKRALVKRGVYQCAGYERRAHQVPVSIIGKNKKRINNIFVDHIHQVGGPGDTGEWGAVISRLFCELEGLQILCKECHDAKSKDEREQRKKKS